MKCRTLHTMDFCCMIKDEMSLSSCHEVRRRNPLQVSGDFIAVPEKPLSASLYAESRLRSCRGGAGGQPLVNARPVLYKIIEAVCINQRMGDRNSQGTAAALHPGKFE